MADKGKPLSVKQNAVIYCLQNGWSLLTSSESRTIYCCSKEGEFEFSRVVFWNLVEKGLIYQQLGYPFDYILTTLGKSIKTKKWSITNSQSPE